MVKWRITWACRPCSLVWVVRRARTLNEGGTCPRCGGRGEMPWEVTGLLPPPLLVRANEHPPGGVEARAELNGVIDGAAKASLRRVIPL